MTLDSFRRLAGLSHERRRFVPRNPYAEEEEDLAMRLQQARETNAHVAMGNVMRGTQSMAAESRVQVMLRGMHNEVDRDRG